MVAWREDPTLRGLDASEQEILEREIREGRAPQFSPKPATKSPSKVAPAALSFGNTDTRDARDPAALGEALLALRRRAPKAPLSALYERHRATLADAGR